MKALIFGASGQDGYYLKKLLESQRIEVITFSRSGSMVVGDVGNRNLVADLLKRYRPLYVFHLAANSTTSYEALFDNHNSIATGTINILDAVKNCCPTSRVFLSGSAMQFKNDGSPIDENTPFEGSSPYATCRIYSTYAARYYRDFFGLKVYVGYFFNHDSPLRTERHVNQKIIAAAKRISAGSNEMLELGSLSVKKEFNYAGDVIDAVWKLVNQDTISEAVIGSGKSHSIQEWVEYVFGCVKKDWRQYVTVKPDFVPEYVQLVSNPERIKSLGWQPETDIYKLADLMVEGV